MKALILAAGLGSRLAPLTNDRPKSMVCVNGKSILEKQIDNLQQNNITDITIVTGYKFEIINNLVKSKYNNINIINNINYKNTNNMYSAYLAKDYLKDAEFIMMNADVYFDASILNTLVNYKETNAIVTDIGNYIEESMKVRKEKEKIVEISKEISKEKAFGSSIDIYKFSKEASKAFFDKCSEYINIKNDLNKWSEVALNDILDKIKFSPCPLAGRWVEIDNIDDLNYAERLFNNARYI